MSFPSNVKDIQGIRQALQRLSVDTGLAVLIDGTRMLTAAWDAGSWQIRAETFQSDVATGTAPLTVASTTVVTNLNADTVDGSHASAFSLATHLHDGQTIECDGIDSNAASFDLDVDGTLNLNPQATGNVALFGSAASGETKYFTVSGFRASDSLRAFKIGVGVDAANSVSMYLDTTRVGLIDSTLKNIAFGGDSLTAFTSGIRNTAYGDRALQRVTTGELNFGLGYEAGAFLTSGYQNVCIGSQAMGYGTGDHNNNMVIGTQAMYGITSGTQISCIENVVIGTEALKHAYYVRRNVAIGTYAMQGLGTSAAQGVLGDYNVAIGYQALKSPGGDGYCMYNTVIGANTAATLRGGDNNILVGYGQDVATGSTSDTLKIGNTQSNATALLTGDLANNYLYLASDTHRLYFGTGNDAYLIYNGTQLDIVTNAVAASDVRLFPNATSGQTSVLSISGYPAGQSLQTVTMGQKAATDGVFLFSGATDVISFEFDKPVNINSGDVSGCNWVIDEDNMASNLATKVPTQQSVKAYVDSSSGSAAAIRMALLVRSMA